MWGWGWRRRAGRAGCLRRGERLHRIGRSEQRRGAGGGKPHAAQRACRAAMARKALCSRGGRPLGCASCSRLTRQAQGLAPAGGGCGRGEREQGAGEWKSCRTARLCPQLDFGCMQQQSASSPSPGAKAHLADRCCSGAVPPAGARRTWMVPAPGSSCTSMRVRMEPLKKRKCQSERGGGEEERTGESWQRGAQAELGVSYGSGGQRVFGFGFGPAGDAPGPATPPARKVLSTSATA